MSELLDWAFRGKRSGQTTGHKPAKPAGRQVKVKGFRLDKDGRLVKETKHLDVSTRLKQKNSKRVRVARRGTP